MRLREEWFNFTLKGTIRPSMSKLVACPKSVAYMFSCKLLKIHYNGFIVRKIPSFDVALGHRTVQAPKRSTICLKAFIKSIHLVSCCEACELS